MRRFNQSAKKLGKKLPKVGTGNEPTLLAGLEFYIDAFIDLDTERSHAMGWTRIPWHSIVRYAEFYQLTEDQSDDLVYFVNKMDLAHIEELEKKDAAKREQK